VGEGAGDGVGAGEGVGEDIGDGLDAGVGVEKGVGDGLGDGTNEAMGDGVDNATVEDVPAGVCEMTWVVVFGEKTKGKTEKDKPMIRAAIATHATATMSQSRLKP